MNRNKRLGPDISEAWESRDGKTINYSRRYRARLWIGLLFLYLF